MDKSNIEWTGVTPTAHIALTTCETCRPRCGFRGCNASIRRSPRRLTRDNKSKYAITHNISPTLADRMDDVGGNNDV